MKSIALLCFTLFFCSSYSQLQDLTGLVKINLLVNDNLEWNSKIGCNINYIDSSYQNGCASIIIGAKAKMHGGTSRKYPKRSYTLKLDYPKSLVGLPKDKDWILNASYIDKTFIRHQLYYELFYKMNKRHNIAPKCAYVSVFKSNEYQGLYVLMQRLDASTLKLNKTDSLAMIFKEPIVFYPESTDLFEDINNIYNQKFPAIENINHSSFLDSFNRFLKTSSPIQFTNDISKWIDMNNVTDWYLMLELSNNSDGIMKNFYLYKKDHSSPFRIAVWDADHSFGRDGDNELNMMKTEPDLKRNILFRRLLDNELYDFENKVKFRWHQLRSNLTIDSKSFDEMINDYSLEINQAIASNEALWPINAKWYYDANSFEDEIEIIKSFVRLRIQQLDKLYDYH
jgi:hypothetical protein